ncbi:hypothetical protein I4F81_002425 [Pyropia yezoensis]|uniref:Uncharacterized protein n=1 Tax=Pyropia yezoensis TaxID=2788 RepID=A0ACC3BPC8_PYRYE|nr:hypothetical protein I4F81_002425 [Neopyropia yezoensis]
MTRDEAAVAAESSDDDVPGLVEDAAPQAADKAAPEGDAAAAGGGAGGEKNYSRGEKKARKALSKLSLKPVANVSRVTLKKNKNVLFVIDGADVYKSPTSDTYVVFGEAKIEDLAAKAAAKAAQQHKMSSQMAMAPPPSAGAVAGSGATGRVRGGDFPAAAAGTAGVANKAADASAGAADGGGGDDDDEPLDETGVEAKDIELVMQQADVSRAKAVKALLTNDGDIVNAIMALTM